MSKGKETLLAKDRLTTKQLVDWLSQWPEGTKVLYDMDCFHATVDLRVIIPANLDGRTGTHDLPLVSTISL